MTSVGLSKSKDGKTVPKSSVASNGTVPSESARGKAPALKTKGKSFNDRQAADSLKAASVQTVSKVEGIYLHELPMNVFSSYGYSFCGT